MNNPENPYLERAKKLAKLYTDEVWQICDKELFIERIAAFALEVSNEVLEEVAKLAEKLADGYGSIREESRQKGCWDCANHIRALKSEQKLNPKVWDAFDKQNEQERK